MEAKLTSGDDGEVVPLLQIQLEKPVDDMTETEMREVLKSLPVTIGLDSAFLQGYHGLDDCADPDEYDDAAEDFDDMEEAEEDYDDVEEVEEGREGDEDYGDEEEPLPRKDKGKAREPPVNAMPPPISVHYAQSPLLYSLDGFPLTRGDLSEPDSAEHKDVHLTMQSDRYIPNASIIRFVARSRGNYIW